MQLREAVANFTQGYFWTCNRSEKTRIAYETDLMQLRSALGDSVPLQKICADSLERWAQDLRSNGYAPASIRRKFATAGVFFSYFVRKGLIEQSPLWRIRLHLGCQPLLPRNLKQSDVKKLIEEVWRVADPASSLPCSPRDPDFLALRNVAVIEILFATGIRAGEIVSLCLKDWNAEDSTFIVMGKGSRQRLAVMPDERSKRAVEVYLVRRRALKLGHDALLANASGDRLSTQGVARIVSFAAKNAGLEYKVTPHMVRHTVATLLLRCGADIRIIQEVLGHASITTTQLPIVSRVLTR